MGVEIVAKVEKKSQLILSSIPIHSGVKSFTATATTPSKAIFSNTLPQISIG
jgi:hypothetical protein